MKPKKVSTAPAEAKIDALEKFLSMMQAQIPSVQYENGR